MKRLFDIIFALWGISVLFPILLIIGVLVAITSKGGAFYRQVRVGKDGVDFSLLKFRSMAVGSDKKGLLTVGANDSRVTPIGVFIRKFKLDELPQLINVLIGDMSFVGPRPEVRKYVDQYSEEQLEVLNVRPGITDYASLEYIHENELLAQSIDPEKTYVEEIMPEKLRLNKKYVQESGVITDVKIIILTLLKIIKK